MSSSLQIVAGAVGCCLLLGAVVWRRRARRRATSPVRVALVDRDPEARQAALSIVADQGLGPYLELLVERTQVEDNDDVRRAMADVVLRHQWEPADNPRLVELRLWAQSELRAQEARRVVMAATGTDGAGSSAGAEEALAVPGAEARAVDAHDPARGDDGIEVDLIASLAPAGAPDEGRPGIHVDPRPLVNAPSVPVVGHDGMGTSMPSETVHGRVNGSARPSRVWSSGLPVGDRRSVGGLSPADERPPGAVRTVAWSPRASADVRRATPVVTGAGGPAGVAVIRSLRSAGHRVVAVDTDGLAAGLRMAEEGALVPRYDDPTFVDAVCEVASRTGADLLIPTLSEELIALAGSGPALSAVGVSTWLPSGAAVDTCIDKWRFAELLDEEGIPGPPTNLGSAKGVPGSWVVKPRFGRGSRQVFMIERATDLPWALQRVEEPIVQTRLTGKEFTVDALVDRGGNVAGAIPRWRLETRAGISTRGRTFYDEALVAVVARLLAAIGLTGPANVQGFIGGDGLARIVEVNPRFSGGLPLSLAAGADLVGEYVRGALGEDVRPERLAFRDGVTMIRHLDEIFE